MKEKKTEKPMATKRKLGEEKLTARYKKVRGHCHLTGRQLEAAHQACKFNIEKVQFSFIPNVFHLFSIYDSRLLFKILMNLRPEGQKNIR